MASAINKNLLHTAISQQPPLPFRTGQETFQHISASSQTAHLSLRTAEGDIVTFSGLLENYQAMESKSIFSPTSSRQGMTALLQNQESMAVSVQGDLNDEELADILRLVNDLTAIAASFFAGDHETAMTAAMNLGEMGSVSRLSATFTRQVSMETRLTGAHPLPASLEKYSDALRRQLPLVANGEGHGAPNYGEVLRTRWQQILAVLETAANTAPAQQSPAASGQETARKMMERMEQTLGQHPGLSPFAGPLATQSLTRAASAARPGENHPDMARAFNALQDEFSRQLRQWLTGPAPGRLTAEG